MVIDEKYFYRIVKADAPVGKTTPWWDCNQQELSNLESKYVVMLAIMLYLFWQANSYFILS